MSASSLARHVYALPALMGALTLAGLVVALLYDGVADLVAVAFVAFPLALLVRSVARAFVRASVRS